MNEQRLREIEEDISRDRALAYYYVEELLAEIRRLQSAAIPETVFGSVPVEVGEVPDMGAPVFGIEHFFGVKPSPGTLEGDEALDAFAAGDEIRMSQVSDPKSYDLAPEVEEALRRRLAEGFPRKVERKG